LIRVQIETDSAVTRAGLEALLREQPGLEVVSAASEADVLIRDDVTELAEDLPIVVLSDELSPQDGLRSGARAVLSRNAPPAQIVAAIQAASAGLVVIPAEASTFVLPRAAEQIAEPLTRRETDVLEMLAEGVSNKVIAYRLGISEHTAKFHVNSILAKLDAGTRTEAVMRGIRLGLIKI
jgi:two-component system nitrate/nitrite response regulator NarL